MDTPICDFVRAYADRNALRLHMPGHKGLPQLGIEHLDITEIDGADVLYHGDGIIQKSEQNAARLFGSAKTLYSTEGSSLAIRAMLTLAVRYAKAQGRRPLIAAGRNAHKVFMSATALLDLDVAWLYPETSGSMISCTISASELARRLDAMAHKPIAVYLTSPDYLGNCPDLRPLAEICHAREILLLVDNAHGAYLHFLPESRHPIALGADACCDSAHKTLPVLTGGAYLHLSPSAPSLFGEYAESSMALFASTSPSYLILQSLDLANRYLSEGYAERLAEFCPKADALKETLRERGFSLIGNEPLKLTVSPKAYGYTGDEVAAFLAQRNVVCEFYDADFVTMMLTPEIGEEGLLHVREALLSMPRREAISDAPPTMTHPESVLSIREALLSPSCTLPTEQCVGRVLADAQIACPPAIPIVVCGERMDESAVRTLQYYGVTECRVVETEQ